MAFATVRLLAQVPHAREGQVGRAHPVTLGRRFGEGLLAVPWPAAPLLSSRNRWSRRLGELHPRHTCIRSPHSTGFWPSLDTSPEVVPRGMAMSGAGADALHHLAVLLEGGQAAFLLPGPAWPWRQRNRPAALWARPPPSRPQPEIGVGLVHVQRGFGKRRWLSALGAADVVTMQVGDEDVADLLGRGPLPAGAAPAKPSVGPKSWPAPVSISTRRSPVFTRKAFTEVSSGSLRWLALAS